MNIKDKQNYFNGYIKGSTLCIAWIKAIYSASSMISAITVCILLHHNNVNPTCINIFGDCDKVVRENGTKDCPNGGTHNGTYHVVTLDKGEKSRAVRSSAGITRGDVKTPLGGNILILY